MSGVEDNEGRLFNVTELGELCGSNRDTVRARIKALGVCSLRNNPQGHGLYRASDVLQLKAAPERSPSEQDPGVMTPKDRKDWYDSEKGRIWLEKEQRQLIPASEVVTVYSSMAKSAAQVLNTLPDILERDLAMAPAAVARVQSIIDSLRDTLADQMYETSAAALNFTGEGTSDDR